MGVDLAAKTRRAIFQYFSSIAMPLPVSHSNGMENCIGVDLHETRTTSCSMMERIGQTLSSNL